MHMFGIFLVTAMQFVEQGTIRKNYLVTGTGANDQKWITLVLFKFFNLPCINASRVWVWGNEFKLLKVRNGKMVSEKQLPLF